MENSSATGIRIQGIQVLRGFAAMAVIVVHAVGRTHIGWPESEQAYPVHFAGIGHAGVDLFFVISGFLMAYLHRRQFGVDGAPGKFMIRRLVRIVPIYWLLAALALTINVVAPTLISDGRSLDVAWILGNFFFVPWPDHTGSIDRLLIVGWTLDYEMLFYVLFSLALIFRRGLVMLCAFMLSLYGIGLVTEPSHPVLTWITNRLLLEFLAGVAIAEVFHRVPRVSRVAAVTLVVAGIAGLVLPHLFPEVSRAWMRGVSCALIVLGTVWLQAECRSLVGRWLVLAGDASYSMYLTQVFSLPAIVVILKLAGVTLPAPLTMVVLTIGAIVAGLIFWRTIEKPMTDALRRRVIARPNESSANQPVAAPGA